MLKYSRCGCKKGIDNHCYGFFCKTVDCDDNQVIPYGPSGSGELSLGYVNEKPIKYQRPLSCIVTAEISGLNGGDYYDGYNGTFHLYTGSNDYVITLEAVNACVCSEENDSRFGSAVISLFLAGADPLNPTVGVTDDSPADFIYSEDWAGDRPTIWMKLQLSNNAEGPVYNFSTTYELYGNTGVTYDGDYQKSGSVISVPEPTCSNHINTGSLDGTNLELEADLTLLEESHSIIPLDGSDVALCDYTSDTPIKNYQTMDLSAGCHIRLTSTPEINIVEDKYVSQGAAAPSNIFNFCYTDYTIMIEGVIDEKSVLDAAEEVFSTCDCGTYLNRSYRGTYIDYFSPINGERRFDTLCCCEDEGVCIDYFTVTFYQNVIDGLYKTFSDIKFYDSDGMLLLTFHKDYGGSVSPLPLDTASVTDVQHTMTYQHPSMIGKCDFTSATVTLTVNATEESSPCNEIELGCETFCLGQTDSVLITIPAFTLAAYDFTQYYRWITIAFPNTPVYGPTQPVGTLPDTSWNAYINAFIAECGGTYAFPGGEYILNSVDGSCIYEYGNEADCYGIDPYIKATLVKNRFQIEIHHRDFYILFDDIGQTLPYNVCCEDSINWNIECYVAPRTSKGIGETCGDYPAIPVQYVCQQFRVDTNLDTCVDSVTYKAGFVPRVNPLTNNGNTNCGSSTCTNAVIRRFSCYTGKNIDIVLETV